MIAASIALIAVGSLAGAYQYVATGQRIGVLAVARDVPAGATITADDLVEARIASDPLLKPVPSQDLAKVIGKRAVTSLPAGTLLSEQAVTSSPLMTSGQQLASIALAPAQFPATPFTPGQRLQLVHTPKDGSTGTAQAPEAPMAAGVVRVGKPDNAGDIVVDVAVTAMDGPTLARWAARGEVAFLQLPAGG
ncbi:hypothetical protein P3T36_007265 [Kitasatospora sp. MAP12-15]|uniref:SAF domain-containing protein n=1 Tax=unclassified Kitasatospora TaxID=2633591 RepID=UPI00247510FB|nr:SAF domain-containing protein [Kitasatospora sp. MAP12-44]MDH6115648.1 hypothetical protein [Kitasatospora sp. MAP12-44]